MKEGVVYKIVSFAWCNHCNTGFMYPNAEKQLEKHLKRCLKLKKKRGANA